MWANELVLYRPPSVLAAGAKASAREMPLRDGGELREFALGDALGDMIKEGDGLGRVGPRAEAVAHAVLQLAHHRVARWSAVLKTSKGSSRSTRPARSFLRATLV